MQHFLQLRKRSRAARKAFADRMLCRADIEYSHYNTTVLHLPFCKKIHVLVCQSFVFIIFHSQYLSITNELNVVATLMT